VVRLVSHPYRCAHKLLAAFVFQAIAPEAVRFLFEGKHINGSNTPAEIEMEDGDAIDCVLEQTGG
jgi:Ubiquitin-2 like Rad60 SUMO-like